MSTADAAPRVPAWKRIGLKLKYAKDTAQDSENVQPPVEQSPKPVPVETLNKSQKRPFEDTKLATPAKRAKSFEGPAIHSKPSGGKRSAFDDYQRSRAQAPQRHIGSLGPSGTLQAAGVAPKKVVFDDDDDSLPPLPQYTAELATPVQQPARPPSPRKSVSFTPDTKGQDGFSRQNFFKVWAAGEDPAERTAVPAVVEEPKREKKKKVKNSKSTLIDKDKSATKTKSTSRESTGATEDSDASTQALPYVDYLQQYHKDRGNWKFSKKHQNNLLKNLFNIYRIPPRHNPAIVQYISTIQGAARLRVAEEALSVLKRIWKHHKDEEDMPVDTPAARRVAYYQALHRHIERYATSGAGRIQYIDDQLKEMKREVEEGQRGEQILDVLENELVTAIDADLAKENAATPAEIESSASEPTTVEPPARAREISEAPTPDNLEKKKRNKRKARTRVSEDDDESSSEDSSEHESE